MNPDPIQAMVAQCLVDPPFLEKTMRCARDEAAHPVVDASAPPMLSVEQYDQIRKVQAFIVKVKHNALRRILPCTFRLLSAAQLEMRFFLSFAPVYIAARHAGPLPLTQHLQHLIPAMETFLDQTNDPAGPLIREMLSHECALHALSLQSANCLQEGLVKWRGSCLLVQRRFDVAELAIQLKHNPLTVAPQPAERPHHLLYQSLHPGATAVIREVDLLTALVFKHSTATTCLTTLAAKLTHMVGSAIDEETICDVLAQARHAGIVVSINATLPGSAI